MIEAREPATRAFFAIARGWRRGTNCFLAYSTVTLFAKFLGWSTSVPLAKAA